MHPVAARQVLAQRGDTLVRGDSSVERVAANEGVR
jgi:hypothetical protein